MKKIMMLGGSTQQIPAIEYANKQGYHTILCDYLPDNPGQDYSDKFYQVSTTDKKAILEVARKEKIDGIVAYASDPAAPTAAYVAEELNLPTNPYSSVEILAYKDKFREFLKDNNFSNPMSGVYTSKEEALDDIDKYQFPVMVKPTDSSGSKGVSKITMPDKLEAAFEEAMIYSQNSKIIIEEYIEKDHAYLIGGDCFVIDGKVEYWGLLNCHRNPEVNPLVPVGKSYPLFIEEVRLTKVKETIQQLVDILDIKFGGFNMEVMVNSEDDVYIIEMGPRNGGNKIPELLYYINGVNMIEASIELALGNDYEIKIKDNQKYISSFNLHINKDGILNELTFSPKIQNNIFMKSLFKAEGDKIEYFNASNKALGIVFMEFDSKLNMVETMDLKCKWYEVVTKNE